MVHDQGTTDQGSPLSPASTELELLLHDLQRRNRLLERQNSELLAALESDLTERKLAEEKLRASEAHLNEAQRLTKLGSWERDYSRETLYWSDEMFRITQLTPAEFGNDFENYLAIIHPGDRERFLLAARNAHRDQAPYELEYRLTMPDGGVKWVHSRATASYDRNGAPLIMTGSIQDITERKLADEALLRSRELLNLIIDAVPALMAYVDREYRYSLVNQSYEEQFGLSVEAIRGRHVRELLGESCWEVVRPFAERALAGEQTSHEVTVPDPAGAVKSLLTVCTPDRDPQGVVRGYVALTRDITAQKETEEALRGYGRRLIDLEEEVRRKLASELHDEMGPELTALNFDLSLMSGIADEAPGRRLPELVADAGQLVNGLSSKVRNIIARLQPPVLFDYGLEAALRWYAGLMAKRTGIKLSVITDGIVPRLPKEHELALFRIAKEALTNAVKYSGTKRITIRVGCNGTEVRLSIRDKGKGFDPAATSPSDAGGWGVTIMRERTIMLGGTFRLETAPGKGTTIHLEIPKEEPHAD